MKPPIATSTRFDFSKKIFLKKKDLQKYKYKNMTSFRSRIFKQQIDLLIYGHLNNIKLKDLIKEINDPIFLYDLSLILEQIIDEKAKIYRDLKINFGYAINNILEDYAFFNEFEEVLF